MAAVSKTRQRIRPVQRTYRTPIRSSDAVQSQLRYSRNNCFTSMAKDAATRLQIKLANHKALTRMANVGVWRMDGSGAKREP